MTRVEKRGFTLTELLIVIVIVAVLVAVAIPLFKKGRIEAREAALRRNLKLIRDAGARAEQDTGLTVRVSDLDDVNPPTNGWRRARMGTAWTLTPIPAGTWRGPYLDRIPMNPFSNTNNYLGGQDDAPNVAWTHWSVQTFNPEYFYYPSRVVGSNGREYRQW
jgi:prepilin-type N-terminal cleavage/methylation domain-containing protein